MPPVVPPVVSSASSTLVSSFAAKLRDASQVQNGAASSSDDDPTAAAAAAFTQLHEVCSTLRTELGKSVESKKKIPLGAAARMILADSSLSLVELRDVLTGMLDDQGKLDWAHQEFEAVRTAGPPTPRAEPWRRTSGIHKLRKPRQLAAVRVGVCGSGCSTGVRGCRWACRHARARMRAPPFRDRRYR